MALELHIAGPGLDVHRRLAAGEPALVLGRDADCSVCLPDPERNVSRRHLSVWNVADVLQFQVLSVVNGVDVDGGELPPGATGVLRPGQSLTVAAYQLTVAPAPVAAPAADPWAEFARAASALMPTEEPTVPDDDPFGDWGFGDTFGPGSPRGAMKAEALVPATDLQPFVAGLGLQPGQLQALTQGELEAVGRLTRMALAGLLQALQGVDASRRSAGNEDRTVVEPRAPNPLRMDTPLEAKLAYLLGAQVPGAGFMAPERALAEAVGEVLVHQQATGEALRQTLHALLQEFDPEALKARLLGGGAKLFESARAWDAFARDYAERRPALDKWVQQALDRHFAEAYAQALVRLKRDTGARRRGPS